MRELLADYERLRAAGPVGRAVVTQVWGSAPRPEGATLLAGPNGAMAGSVSGGCVESAAAEAIQSAMAQGAPRKMSWGVTHERAWEMGLSCGGTIEVFIEPSVRDEVLAAARRESGSVVATVIEGAAPLGSGLVLLEDGSGAIEVFLEVFPRRPTLLVFGGVHIATALVRLAKPLGYRTVVADGREAFLTRERFPDADELLLGWPEEVFQRVGLNPATCVVLLTHDPKFDEPALELALRSDAGYVGAIGSRKTQTHRRERLRALGFSEAAIARLHGPIGLDLGGREPAEIALAILAEISAVRHGKAVTRDR